MSDNKLALQTHSKIVLFAHSEVNPQTFDEPQGCGCVHSSNIML